MSKPLIIAIDAGGTAVKVVAFDLHGTEVAHRAADVRTDHYPDGRVERDPEAFWAGTARAIREVIADCDDREILGVGCTGFGNGIFLVDENGHGTRPGIVSVDHRADPIVRELNESGVAKTVSARTGHKLWGGQTLMQLVHLARNEPEVMSRTRWALACKDLIRFRLTGEALTDPTDASGGALMDLAAQTYAQTVFTELGAADVLAKLPPIVPSTAVAGRVCALAARETGLPQDAVVAGSMMDVAACSLGSGAVDEPFLTMIAGTWSINSIETAGARPDATPLLNMLYRNGASRLIADGSPSSAANLSWFLEKGLAGRLSFEDVNALVAQTPPTARRCQFLPYVFGPEPRRGGFTNLAATDDLGTMLRSIFESVVFQHRLHAESAANHAGLSLPDTIRLAGGAARSNVWAQIFADICQRTVETTRALEVGALGAAICAAVASGAFADLKQATRAMTGVARRYVPDRGLGAFYNDRLEEFQRLDQGMAELLAGP
ncbi:FGGY-family carbohydrate kinase [Chelativorans sp. AA-79]|uniref:FGGY-family carbohydrate kinase n=1 Tax=Chelativorans sp. AA-79 TaxID=3028735 RepID=UPI0023F7B974|nr:FGGY-family carbohydrate kinase [Chelativorans sp. AA-79]WEX08643.1 carbohydrate kinase [Chelativorans sp. AA-79]